MQNDDIVIINTDNLVSPAADGSLCHKRASIYAKAHGNEMPAVTVYIQSYNRLEKTKHCVESVLRFSQGVDYELLLVDNGSNDGTFEYYKSVTHPRKKILRFEHNLGGISTGAYIYKLYSGKAILGLPDDIVVSPRWLNNIMACLNSAEDIGMVNPMCTNCSNLQAPNDFQFDTLEEFWRKAERFNVSDPAKWQQRMRLITLGTAYKREVIDLMGATDAAFTHNFTEDDMCLRIRRAGYRLMLCGDAVVHHDHEFYHRSAQAEAAISKDLALGAAVYSAKYYGLHAWEDVINFEQELLALLPRLKLQGCSILGIDVRMGTPILELANKLTAAHTAIVKRSAFTTNAKYYEDLQTICKQEVYCDRINYLDAYFLPKTVDYIIIGTPIDEYTCSKAVLSTAFSLLKPGGSLLFKANNPIDYLKQRITNAKVPLPSADTYGAAQQIMYELFEELGAHSINTGEVDYDIDDAFAKVLLQELKCEYSGEALDTIFAESKVQYVLYCVNK